MTKTAVTLDLYIWAEIAASQLNNHDRRYRYCDARDLGRQRISDNIHYGNQA